jgi:hypothetical protein
LFETRYTNISASHEKRSWRACSWHALPNLIILTKVATPVKKF